MASFEDREKGYERKFAHDEELKFKANARRNKLLGLWAAGLMGIKGDEAQAYAERLAAAGVAARYTCYAGMVHGFLQMRGLVPDAQAAIEDIARAIN